MSELTGGQVSYYVVKVEAPRREEQPAYQAECEDIISALQMTFDEGCIFKALWRTAAARQGNGKPGVDPIYDAEKILHYAKQVERTTRVRKAPKARQVPIVQSPVVPFNQDATYVGTANTQTTTVLETLGIVTDVDVEDIPQHVPVDMNGKIDYNAIAANVAIKPHNLKPGQTFNYDE